MTQHVCLTNQLKPSLRYEYSLATWEAFYVKVAEFMFKIHFKALYNFSHIKLIKHRACVLMETQQNMRRPLVKTEWHLGCIDGGSRGGICSMQTVDDIILYYPKCIFTDWDWEWIQSSHGQWILAPCVLSGLLSQTTNNFNRYLYRTVQKN